MLVAIALPLLLAACAHSVRGADTAPEAWRDARQLVLVTAADWDADRATLRRYERTRDAWRQVGEPQPVMLGRSGSAWGLGLHPAQSAGPTKREGDGRAPAGVFAIGSAFGYAASANTSLPYEPMQASDYCIDVPESPLYTQLVDANVVGSDAVAGSTEPMRRDVHVDGDQRYRLGFIIEHNRQARPMAGSCIFAHLWKSPDDATAGCTAMAPATMDALLAWLRPERQPVFVLLPDAEYARLQSAWGMPVIEARP